MDYYHVYKNTTRLIGQDINFNWAFFVCVDEVPDLIAWKKEFSIPGSEIICTNRYNTSRHVISPEELEILITFRQRGHSPNPSGNLFIGTHNLIHRRVGVEGCTSFIRPGEIAAGNTTSYVCVANEDCWDLCRTLR